MNALLRPLLQQSFRSQSSWLLIIALSLAICATAALSFSNQQIKQAIVLQAADLLAADLVVEDHEPLKPIYAQRAQADQLKQSNVTVFSTMASTSDQFVMVLVKAVDQEFPLRGQLIIHDQPSAKIQPGEVWLSARAQSLLNAKLGDHIHIADATLKFTGIIEKDTNQETGFSGFSPVVVIHQADIAQTRAIQVGSRVDYRLLMSGEPAKIAAYQTWFKQQKQAQIPSSKDTAESDVKIKDAKSGNNRLLQPIENLETFLQLSNLLTILLCGIAIALSAHRYVQQNQDHIALIRCLGANKSQLMMAFLSLLGIVLVCSVVIGTVFGAALGYGLLQVMLQFIPQVTLTISWFDLIISPLPIAILTSALVLLGFVLPHVYQLLKTPPIRVLRATPSFNRASVFTVITGLASLFILSLILTSSVKLTAQVLGGMMLLSVLMYGILWLVLKLIKRSKGKMASYVRLPYQTALQITALALGLSLISILIVLRSDVLTRWEAELPSNTPNQFVYGLPVSDKPSFESDIQAAKWASTALYPNVRGRLIAKNGQPFSDELIKKNNSLRRELNLTQSNAYPAENKIIAGDEHLKQVNDVSIESETAKSLGIALGDTLTFSLPEGQFKAKVVNIRTVEWQSFTPNFFFIFAPGTLDENAGSYIGSFFVPKADQNKLLNLIQHYNTTVFIDISMILDQVKHLISVMIKIMTVLAALVAVSGFLVLMACINILMDERKKEVALWRAFGSAKAKIRQMMMLELAFMGMIAGVTSCLFAEVIGFIASRQLHLSPQLHGWLWLVLPISMMLLCALIGRYRLSYLCEIPPLQNLRSYD